MGCPGSKEADEVRETIALSKSSDPAEVEKAVAQLAEMAAAHDKDTGRVLHHDRVVYQEHMTGLGGLELFIALSKSELLNVRRSASLGLLNLSFAVLSSHEIISREGVQAVLRNMQDQDDEVRAHGIWTLVNLLINPRNHVYCKEEETLKLVIELMAHPDSNTRFWALRCVCNFCLGTGETQVQLARLGVLSPIFHVLKNTQPEKGHATDARMKFFGLACLSNLTSKNKHVENMIVEMEIDILFELMKSEYQNIPAEAAKVITNLAVQNEDNQMKLVNSGGLAYILPLTTSDSQACQYQHPLAKDKIFEHDVIDSVHKLLMSDKNEIQRKASAMITVLAQSESCKQQICAHAESDNIKARLQTLSEAGNLSNFDSLMARVRASQALSALEDDNYMHYKKTVLRSIDDVLTKFQFSTQFSDSTAVDQWNRDYNAINEQEIEEVSTDAVRMIFETFTANLQKQAQMGVLRTRCEAT